MIKFSQKGRPPLNVRHLLDEMNEYLGTMNDSDKLKFSQKTHMAYEELEETFSEMKSVSSDGGFSSQVNGSSNESSPEPKASSSIEEANIVEEEADYDIPSDAFEYDAFDPNLGDTIKRGYNEEKATETYFETIPEPTFSEETIVNNPTQATQPNSQPQNNGQQFGNPPPQNQGTPPKEKPEMVNPAMNELGEKERRLAAETTVDTVLAVYDKLHEWAQPLAKIKDKKINALERAGLISPTDTIHVGNGEYLNAREIIAATNKGIEEVLTPDPTFHAKVRPALIREFTKRGLALTDMQQILMHVGIDIAGKVAGIVDVRRNLNSVLDNFKEMRQEKLAQMRRDQQPSPQAVNVDSISSSSKKREDVIDDPQAFSKVEEAHEVI